MIKKLFYPLGALVVALSLIGLTAAQGQKSTLTGNLIDKACATGKASKAEHPQEVAGKHPKSCSLMENCAKSGFGVYADGKFYEFDEKGSTLAKAALEKSTKDRGATFKVVGTVDGGKMTVDSITEAN